MFSSYVGRVYSVPPVIDALRATINAGTEYSCNGIWLGNPESSAMLEIFAMDVSELERVFTRAHNFARDLGESSILVTVNETDATLILQTGDRLPVVGSILATVDH